MVHLKFKVSRRILDNVWQMKKLTPKQTNLLELLRRNTNRKQSDYSVRLLQMKKLATFYGIRRQSSIGKKNLMTYLDKEKSYLLKLETRLDIILIRLNFCSSISASRQLISHEKICVNYHVVKNPSYQLKIGDIVSVSKQYLDSLKSMIKARSQRERFFSNKVPHIEVNYKLLNAVLLYEPCIIYFPYKIKLDLLF